MSGKTNTFEKYYIRHRAQVSRQHTIHHDEIEYHTKESIHSCEWNALEICSGCQVIDGKKILNGPYTK